MTPSATAEKRCARTLTERNQIGQPLVPSPSPSVSPVSFSRVGHRDDPFPVALHNSVTLHSCDQTASSQQCLVIQSVPSSTALKRQSLRSDEPNQNAWFVEIAARNCSNCLRKYSIRCHKFGHANGGSVLVLFAGVSPAKYVAWNHSVAFRTPRILWLQRVTFSL